MIRSYRYDVNGRNRGQRWTGPLLLAVCAAVTVSVLAGGTALATIRLHDLGLGKLEVSGNLHTTNIVRHPDQDAIRRPLHFGRMDFIQQRNVLNTRIDWGLLRGGRLFGKYRIPGVRRASMFMLYRFSYDSIYDYTPSFSPDYDIKGRDIRTLLREEEANPLGRPGVSTALLKLKSLPQNERDMYKFENRLRELYMDLKFRKIPLSLRIGQQQVVWGEADFFRMLDRANPLDVTWHFAQEVPPPAFGWDAIRRPLFMVKGLYNLGALGPLEQVFIEGYWNPGDWYPVKVAFLPRPWGIPMLDPLNNPWNGAFTMDLCATAPTGRCDRLMNDTILFKQGDYSRWDPLENSQIGLRFHASTPQGVEFTLNYLHQRWSGDDGTPFAPIRSPRVFDIDNVAQDPASQFSRQLIDQGILPAEYITPYVNTVGISANYAEEQFTQTVFRMETILDFGIPFYDRGKLTVLDNWVPGITLKNMWKGMIGFDRSTWIRPLNKKSSFLITGQLFWHYLINNPDCPDNLWDPGARANFQKAGGSCLTGATDLPDPTSGLGAGYRDKVRTWEVLANIGAVGFYRGGSIIPIVAFVVDPMNKFVGEIVWAVDYFVTPNVAVNVAQRLFLSPTGNLDVFGPWGFSSISKGRSETSLRLTYQF